MSQFASLFKKEISRIARKEIRTETENLRRATARANTEISALKKQLAKLQAQLKRASKLATAGSASSKRATADEEDSPSLRFRANGFATLRKKLGISAHDMGQLLGASAQSVYHWESGKTRPRAKQLQSIAQVRKMGKKEVVAQLATTSKSAQ
jgi:DNA-binding transcriptional regulator YiaG